MKPPSLNSRDRRALMLGAIAVVPAVLYIYAVRPAWRAITEQRGELATQERKLAADRVLIQRMPGMRERSIQTRAWLGEEAHRLFHGNDDIAATSDLAQYATRAAAAANIRIRQTETRPGIVVNGPLHAVRLDVRAEGSTRALMMFLKQIEGGDRLVRIGRVNIEHTTPIAATNDEDVGDTGSSRLSVTAELYGYTILSPKGEYRVAAAQRGARYTPIGNGNVTPIDIADAIEHDPFSPSRNVKPAALPEAKPEPPPFPVSLVGTVVDQGNNGSFAICQLDGTVEPSVVHVGETIGEFTLRTVQRGSIVLVDGKGKLFQLYISTPEA